MTEQQHPITPTPALVRKWARFQNGQDPEALWLRIGTLAAQWGADQELEACLKALDAVWDDPANSTVEELQRAIRATRRPKFLSLKEQALQVLASAPGPDYPRVMTVLNADEHALIRQALEALPND